jgi:DNA-binding IclR family transcriptional regulator
VDRALRILTCLGEGEFRLVQLAARLQLHKATVARLLTSLVHSEMAKRNERGYYVLGPAVASLSARALGGYHALLDALRAPLLNVWKATGETIAVNVRVGEERLCIDELESPQMIAYRTGIGSRAPLHVGSGGKVLLAFLPPEEIVHLLRHLRLRPVTERTITSREKLADELESVRRLGYAVSVGERTIGSAAVSVPVFDTTNRLVACVSILGPESRMTPDGLRRSAALLKQSIPHRVQCSPYPPVTAVTPGDGTRS